MVKLGDVAEVVSGGTPKTSVPEYWGDEIVWVTPKDLAGLQGIAITGSEKMLSQEGLNRSSAKPLPAGTVVMSSRAPIGYVGVLQVPGSTNQGCKNFIPSDRIDANYLAFYLRCNTAMLQQMGTGATFKEISAKRAADIPVPLPPLAEQQRIAKILGTVEKAIRAEEQSISKLETLVKNLAPETNRTVPIGEYVERIVSGKSLKEHSTPGGPRVLKISSTTSGYFKPEESKPLDPSYEPPEHHRVQEGDLLVSRANTTELVGASAIVDQPYENLLLPDKLWRLVTKDSVDPFFLWACLQHPLTRNAISKASSGSGGSMKNISQTNFLSVEIPDVDAALQTTVGNQVRTAFHQRALRSSKLTLLRELYTSLSSRAFAGEL
ncbi:restriction endonuclease subunit S [Corynebacterium pseudogenitalium]|uniref:restriction endonuclease subunit S n=1 Tax=Corynebacterium pseudogenitalium TaxID=38303 RepID=UPI003B9F893F